MLQLLNLVQVVNEGLGDLLDQERSICNFELDLLLDPVVSLCILAHILLGDGLRDLTLALESLRVADECWRALNSLL